MFGWGRHHATSVCNGQRQRRVLVSRPNIPDHPTPSHHPIGVISGAPQDEARELQGYRPRSEPRGADAVEAGFHGPRRFGHVSVLRRVVKSSRFSGARALHGIGAGRVCAGHKGKPARRPSVPVPCARSNRTAHVRLTPNNHGYVCRIAARPPSGVVPRSSSRPARIRDH
jgi:hypothetical protein